MTKSSPKSSSTLIYEFYSRSVAYISAAVTLMLGHNLELWNGYYTEALLISVCLPFVTLLIGKKIPPQHEHLRRPTSIAVDSLILGIFMAYMHFAILPSILYFILINTTVLVIGSSTVWFASVIAIAIGAYLGTLLFGFNYDPEVPLIISVVVALGATAHLAVNAYYSGKQTKQLSVLHKEIQRKQVEQQNLSNKVAKYISPQIWELIFSGNHEVKLETQRKKLVVFFSDIKGFTALSEQLESEALTELLNNYLTEMTNIAIKYGGTIDKYIGDGMMVFFGDPKTQGAKKDTLACVAMAIEMKKHMKVLRQNWRAQGVQSPLEIRMGINTGYCTVGNFGTESRMDYTIIGKEVNMASRLESAADSGEILLSHESYALIQDKIICREKGTITAKGFSRPVPVYEAVDFRHNLAAKTTFVEHELPGFSMYMDTNRINNYDREKISTALENAAKKIKSQTKMQG
ncbi:MAG: class 3 adenylate cyclase [Bermanella sp.]|jgi:class 3 adenylate cyclase